MTYFVADTEKLPSTFKDCIENCFEEIIDSNRLAKK
jgi:hypothetical protein